MSTPSPYSVACQPHQLPTPNNTPFEDQHVLPFVSEISLNFDTGHAATGSSTLPLTLYEIVGLNDRSSFSQYLSDNAPLSSDDYLLAANDDFTFSAPSFDGTSLDSNTFVAPPRGPLVPRLLSSGTQYMTGNTASLQQLPLAPLNVSIHK